MEIFHSIKKQGEGVSGRCTVISPAGFYFLPLESAVAPKSLRLAWRMAMLGVSSLDDALPCGDSFLVGLKH